MTERPLRKWILQTLLHKPLRPMALTDLVVWELRDELAAMISEEEIALSTERYLEVVKR